MESNKKKESPYVKYPVCLSYLFNPGESRFIIHMIEIEFLKDQGYNTNWTRAEYMKRMGLNEYSFERCIKRLVKMGLLSKTNNKLKNKVYYSFNMQLYDRLVEILSVTCNIDKLIEFCETKFIRDARPIESITEKETDDLRADNGLLKTHPSIGG
ncbi:MAG: hypothetical protein LBS20_19500 [Prevotella sp.]|jgi:hypothetical protein|nr:hypothetical protein [Prevotella sp.]